ncbi:methyl-accepting chemotaxis protein [Alsobacter sp. KACC 23698]|uniref:Methyl-accepting chemotaxis protein n=1 Tax=Alsobacter sp. KACC 23698 TaxID=3149229 RepID=A0AAU7JA50_9HYPH
MSSTTSPGWIERLTTTPIQFGVAMGLVVWMSIAAMLWSEYDHAQALVDRTTSNLATLFSENASRAIREVDKSLLVLRALYEDDPSDFMAAAYSKRSAQFDSMIFQMAIIGADGELRASNIPTTAPAVNLSDREHFLVHKNSADDKLFVSKPVLGRASGRWSIQLTRRITDRQGRFAGVIVASADPDHFSRLYEAVDLGQGGVVTLVGVDGLIRSRRATSQNSTGASILGTPFFQAITAAPQGNFRMASPIDGVERSGAFKRVVGHDLIVAVGLSTEETMQVIRRQALALVLIGLVGTALIGAVVIIVARARITRLALEEASRTAAAQQAELALRDQREAMLNRDAEILSHVEALGGRLGGSIDTLGRIIADISVQCSRMNEAAARARDGSAGAADISNASAQNVDHIAVSAATISDIGIEAERAVTGALQTFDEAIAQAGRSSEAFSDLDNATRQIDRVVQMIRAVAHQTNMLALNATIEAARAGEAGRGFSVVAQEIKLLSAQTSDATGQISAQLTAIQRAGRTSIESVRGMLDGLKITRDTTQGIAGTVTRQSNTATDIAMTIATAAEMAAKASRSANAIREAAELSDRCASDLLSTTTMLEAEAQTIRLEIEDLRRSLECGSAQDPAPHAASLAG